MSRNEKLLWIVLIGIKLLVPFLVPAGAFELHRDEYLYYAQGQHLAPGFLENPPMVGFLGWLSSLAGGGFFAIRLWPAVFGAATLWLALKICRGFGGGPYAQLLTGIGFLLSAFLRIHILFQPNFLDIFFWTLAAWFTQRYLLRQQRRDLFALAVTLALGWWAKYSVLFFVLALFGAIVLSPQRRWLARRDFWLAITLGLVLILPNIYWQWQQNWPLVHHMEELRETQLKYLSKTTFLKEQLLMFLPACFLWIGGLWWLLRSSRFRVFGLLYLGVLVLLMLGSGKGYYALGIYPMMLAAGGAWMESLLGRTVNLRVAAALLILVIGFPIIFLMLPLQAPREMAAFNERWGFRDIGILRWEDLRDHELQQDFADMLGWKEIARKTYDFYDALPSSVQDSTVIYARNYGYAGSLLYYVKDKRFRRSLICDNGTFLLWIPERLPYRHLLFVGEERPPKSDSVFEHFGNITVVDSCTNPLSRQYGTQILFFENADTTAFPLAGRGLQEMKAKFRRQR
ncbi:glycosyltransferase family 39 protein [Flaviaesturariibacter flavus]|uniref:Glycosyltransferase family 39 protein n=1 Tax=Flaviaesturariibacter flavus TaxID=2502780 RepID=A0A4R1B7W7_9BACT|nr:glycosyltransferase family 39 protein [Flaviaesturariibacter flavus]TCJ13277.1 glycosyltransferase family 39 protein [Flaviaesturariibacter flavus]